MLTIVVFCLGCGRTSGHHSFLWLALLLSMLRPLFLPSKFVPLSHCILDVQMRECLGNHSCMNSQLPVTMLSGTFNWTRLNCHSLLT